jgi:hypothetical protein
MSPSSVSTLIIREHESDLPKNDGLADDLLKACALYQVDPKKRVAILPEARPYFDEDGEIINGNTDDDDDDDEDGGDENGAGPSQRGS